MTWWHCSAAVPLGVNFLSGTKQRLSTQKSFHLSKKTLYPAGVNLCFYSKNYKDWTVTLKIFHQSSPHLNFLSSPPIVHSSASAQLTLIQMPSAHFFHWKSVLFMPTTVNATNMLLFPFAVQDQGWNSLLETFGCIIVKADEFVKQMLLKIGTGLGWIVCLI